MVKKHTTVDASRWLPRPEHERVAQAAKMFGNGPWTQEGLARDFRVNVCTLRSRIYRNTTMKARRGPVPVYTDEQWLHIFLWALAAADRGHAVTMLDIRRRIRKHLLLAKRGRTFPNNMPSASTVRGKIGDIGGLAWRTAKEVKYVVDASDAARVREEFADALRECMIRHGIDPSNLYNADEVGFNSKDKSRRKVR